MNSILAGSISKGLDNDWIGLEIVKYYIICIVGERVDHEPKYNKAQCPHYFEDNEIQASRRRCSVRENFHDRTLWVYVWFETF